MNNNKRPVNLDLLTLKFPPMAISSILHRISGILIFVLFPIILFILGNSLHSEETFQQLGLMLTTPYYKLILWAFGSAMIYHVIAGIRHIIMDLGFGESLCAGRMSSIAVIILAAISVIFLGIWIW